MRLLTKLVRRLKDAYVLSLNAGGEPEKISDIFPGLLDLQTPRFVVDTKFLDFASEIFMAQYSSKLHTISDEQVKYIDDEDFKQIETDEAKYIDDNDIPECYKIWETKHFWLEVTDEQMACYGQPGKPLLVIMLDKNNNIMFSDTSTGKQNRFQYYTDRLKGFIACLTYAMENIPETFIERKDQRIGPVSVKSGVREKPMFTTVSLRGHQTSKSNEHSMSDRSGCRFHFVRGHWMLPFGKTEKVWRKHHWRGDATLGISRKVYVS
jgi:hypothetical protein